MIEVSLSEALSLLDAHYDTFYKVKPFADKTCHPIPCDTRAWSQILISLLTGLEGRKREKGSDLQDGSDVKAANCWCAIDTPRFNGVIPSGRLNWAEDVSALDNVPHIFFTLWDYNTSKHPRCRVWCVKADADIMFREMCQKWYKQRTTGEIKSNNFQLHPPRFQDGNIVRNTCGNLTYPLFFSAIRENDKFIVTHYDPEVLTSGECK